MKKYRNVFLIAGGVILLIALVMKLMIAADDPLMEVARKINTFGYSFTDEDFYVFGGADDTTARELIVANEDELERIIEASEISGFPSDVDKRGAVTVLLAHSGFDDVITLYLVDGEIELAFMQKADGTVGCIGVVE